MLVMKGWGASGVTLLSENENALSLDECGESAEGSLCLTGGFVLLGLQHSFWQKEDEGSRTLYLGVWFVNVERKYGDTGVFEAVVDAFCFWVKVLMSS